MRKNIDTLERVAGLQEEDLVEAHGTFYTSHCVSFLCRKEYTLDWMKGESQEMSSRKVNELVACFLIPELLKQVSVQ